MYRLFFLLLCFFSLIAQDDIPKVDEQLEVQLVELDIKVVNLQGDFIRGLGPDDIEVRENGVLQSIDKMEEISLQNLAENEQTDYRPRAMLLIDFMNSNFRELFPSFQRLTDYFKYDYDQRSEIAISVNNGSIQEVIGFTKNRDKLLDAVKRASELYQNSRFREFYKTKQMDPALYSDLQNTIGMVGFPTDSSTSYLAHEQNKLGQFVYFLSAFTGKKHLILISSAWAKDTNVSGGQGQSKTGLISIREIQTACLESKISLSVISLDATPDLAANESGNTFNTEFGADWGESMALATAGSISRGSHSILPRLLYQTVERGETYYRVRYYSSSKSNQYRDLSVKAKGLARMAHSFAGYYQKKKQQKSQADDKTIAVLGPMQFHLKLPTDWLEWEGSGFTKQRAYYTLSYRVIDAEGNMLAEKVRAGGLERKRRDKDKSPLIETKVNLALPELKGGKLEVRLVDLISGETLLLERGI